MVLDKFHEHEMKAVKVSSSVHNKLCSRIERVKYPIYLFVCERKKRKKKRIRNQNEQPKKKPRKRKRKKLLN